MIRYAFDRVLQVVPVLFGISVVVFLLVRLIPGDPAISVLGDHATAQLIQRVHDELGLDLPIWLQYFHYLGNCLRGDFGTSFFYKVPVWTLTIERVPMSLALMAYSLLLSLAIAVPLAVIAATRRGTIADTGIRFGFTFALGVPAFWIGIMLALTLGAMLRLFPITGGGSGGLDTLRHLTLPALTISFALSPILVRALRSSLIEVLGSDYVTTGRAMGIAERYMMVNYLLRNSLRPVISLLSINIGLLIGGTVITEQVFSVPGVGSLIVSSIATRDYAIIQLATLFFAVLVVSVNLAADLLHRALDPRVQL